MTRRSLFIFAFINTIAVAFITSWITTKWHHHHNHHLTSTTEKNDFHHWLHTQLDLTSAQESALQPAEQDYQKKSSLIRQKITSSSRQLAQAIKSGDPENPEIQSSLTQITTHQAELKKLMLDHFFTMKEHLEPDQVAQLTQWIHDSLTARPSS